jgi:hypothetical protein
LREKYKLEKLLVIEIAGIGVTRTFSSYVPTGDPRAMISGSGYIVNLSDHAYDLIAPVNVVKSAEGAWDEPPKFPGMTNAYYQTLELARERFLGMFSD